MESSGPERRGEIHLVALDASLLTTLVYSLYIKEVCCCVIIVARKPKAVISYLTAFVSKPSKIK